MKQKLLALTCATLLVGASGARAQDPAYSDYYGAASANGSDEGYVGDSAFVGDLGDEDSAVALAGSLSGEWDTVGDWNVEEGAGVLSDAVPQGASDSKPTVPMPVADTYSSAYCETSHVGPMYQAICKPAPAKWLRSEALLWFVEGRNTPPLVNVGPNRENQFGDPIASGMAPGFRFDYGHYLTDNLGVGARVWGLLGENEDYNISSNSGLIIERPYFNTTRLGGPGPDALIVSGLGGAEGSFNAESELDMIAAEVYGRLKFGETKDYRIDLIGGYSFFGIDDSLTLTSRSVLAPDEFFYRDSFKTENRFYGGQLGIETAIHKNRWSFTSLTKVHLGNMNQFAILDGYSQSALFPNPPGPVTNVADENGLFIQGQGGTHEENVFTFIPEMNFRLGYSPRSQVHLTMGYSFIYISSVAMAGDQLNPVVDGVNAAFFTNTPGTQSIGYSINNGGFWMQGIDLGVTFTF